MLTDKKCCQQNSTREVTVHVNALNLMLNWLNVNVP